MAALRHLARWIAWHIGEAEATPLNQPPARITVFSSNRSDDAAA
jgi:hypothetical protein